MRFAFPAVAGTSGLLLLGLAFYGQPALYVQQAREEWSRLFGSSAVDQSTPDQAAPEQSAPGQSAVVQSPTIQPPPWQPADPDRDAVAERMAALQLQVVKLKDELAARQGVVSRNVTTVPSQTAPPSQAALPLQSGLPMQPTAAVTVPSAVNQAASPPPLAAPSIAPMTQPVQTSLNGPTQLSANSGSRSEARKLDWLAPSVIGPTAEPMPPTIVIPQRRDFVTAEPGLNRIDQLKLDVAKPDVSKSERVRSEPVRSEPVRPEPGRQELARVDASKADAARTDPAKPTQQKVAVAKPMPPPPPLPSPSRPDVDDTQSVLARLRQIGPAAAQPSESPAVAEARQPEPRPSTSHSPSLPKLGLARSALANGRIEDARRLLQEAQLQLVFRPVNISGDEQPLAGKGAADVAHALEALSANNIALSRRYIDIAADDLSGNGTNSPTQASDLRATGYAPAYPPR